MKLGTRVIFSKIARKASEYVDYNCMTDEQNKLIEENGYIDINRLEIIDTDTREGFVMGKRKMKQKTTLEYRQVELEYQSSEGLVVLETVSLDVYLVATTMNRTYKVPCDAVEII